MPHTVTRPKPTFGWLAAVDVAVAFLILAAWSWVIAHADAPASWTNYGLAAVSTLPVALRRRWPLPTFVVGAAGVLSALLLGPVPGTTGVAVAFTLYTVVTVSGSRVVVTVSTVALGLALLAYVRTPDTNVQSLTLDLLFLAVVLVAGRGALARQENVRLLQERASRLEQDRVAHAGRAVAAERATIARELHDVVGHAMSQISVQAGMGRMLGSQEPARATSSLAAIEQLSREALQEMRRLTSALRLRESEETDNLDPIHTLEDVDLLVASVAAAGLRVSVERHGHVRSLPTSVELAAYRIVQESLTNIIRHVGPTTARIFLDFAAHDLAVLVENDGGARDDPRIDGSSGFGLLGMHERARALGGRFEAGPQGCGFAVRAHLPIEVHS